MPIPERQKDETPRRFLIRCMSDATMLKEFPDSGQRAAVCLRASKKELPK